MQLSPAQARYQQGITSHGIIVIPPEEEIALSPMENENPFDDELAPPDELMKNRERILSLLDMPKV